jgi:uncharacterized membrane protein (UPF0127 family)
VWLVALFGFAGAGCAHLTGTASAGAAGAATRATVVVDGRPEFCLPVASTADQQAAGLAGTGGAGLIYLFAKPTMPALWTVGVKKPGEVVWVAPNGSVSGVEQLAADSGTLHSPAAAVGVAVELGAGAWHGGHKVDVGSACLGGAS